MFVFTWTRVLSIKIAGFTKSVFSFLNRGIFLRIYVMQGETMRKLEIGPGVNSLGSDWDAMDMVDRPHVTIKLFVESSKSQAEIIAQISGKPVFCVDTNSIYQ